MEQGPGSDEVIVAAAGARAAACGARGPAAATGVFLAGLAGLDPITTPPVTGRRHVRARLVVSWHWNGVRTVVRYVTSRGMPRHGNVTVRCRGPRCPRLAIKRVATARARRLWRALASKVFSAGHRLDVTISAPRLKAERIEFAFRANRKPGARLL